MAVKRVIPEKGTMKATTTKQFGDACEMLVVAKLTLNGMPTVKLPDTWPGYDLIAQPSDRAPQRISVKGTRRTDAPAGHGHPRGGGTLALEAGMDVETPAIYGYGPVLAKAVENGRVSESLLDESVRRVLRDKFALGLFDDPYVSEDPAEIGTVGERGRRAVPAARRRVGDVAQERGRSPAASAATSRRSRSSDRTPTTSRSASRPTRIPAALKMLQARATRR